MGHGGWRLALSAPIAMGAACGGRAILDAPYGERPPLGPQDSGPMGATNGEAPDARGGNLGSGDWGAVDASSPSSHPGRWPRAIAISTGLYHSCALLSDHSVACWGDGSDGKLGTGEKTGSAQCNGRPCALAPETIPGLQATAIAGGALHTCARLLDGSVACWGLNLDGELGSTTMPSSPAPVHVPGVTAVTALAAGTRHTCALLSGGSVSCWGLNGSGQLGNGMKDNGAVGPVGVANLPTAMAIAAGSYHTCALLADLSVQCWGDAVAWGGVNSSSSTPIPIFGLPPVAAISCSATVDNYASHTCALLLDGSVRCWGAGSYGELGDGLATGSSAPVAVSGLRGATSIAAGGYDGHTCAVLSDGSARCWGDDGVGQLGDGSSAIAAPTPVVVSGLRNVAAIAAGGFHTCAVLLDGTVECWGSNSFGQLGDGTVTDARTPVAVTWKR